MKHVIEETTVLELDETQLAAVHGGQDKKEEPVDWTQPGPYIQIRNDALAAKEQAWSDAFKGLSGENAPLKIVAAAYDWAKAKEQQQFAEENLNYIARREEAARQAREADEREAEEQRQRDFEEEQDEALIREAEELLRETDTRPAQGGSGNAPPANQEPVNHETMPSFPINMVNAPPSHEPQITTEQAGPTTIGGSYNNHQDGGNSRLY